MVVVSVCCTTCYAWVHQGEAMERQTLKTLASSPFNKIRICIFPKSYTYNTNEPEFFAFKKGADGKFDFAQPGEGTQGAASRRYI